MSGDELQLLALKELREIKEELQEQTKLLRSIDRKLEREEPKYARPQGIQFTALSN